MTDAVVCRFVFQSSLASAQYFVAVDVVALPFCCRQSPASSSLSSPASKLQICARGRLVDCYPLVCCAVAVGGYANAFWFFKIYSQQKILPFLHLGWYTFYKPEQKNMLSRPVISPNALCKCRGAQPASNRAAADPQNFCGAFSAADS